MLVAMSIAEPGYHIGSDIRVIPRKDQGRVRDIENLSNNQQNKQLTKNNEVKLKTKI